VRGSPSSGPVTGWRPWPPWWASCWAGSCRAASRSLSGWPARWAQSLKEPIVLNVKLRLWDMLGGKFKGSKPVIVRLASAVGAIPETRTRSFKRFSSGFGKSMYLKRYCDEKIKG
jgi:hypothetical protein